MNHPAVIGAIIGIVTVVVVFIIASKKGVRGGEGKKTGVNLAPGMKCPNCGGPIPTARVPKNLRQFMWGGWTCESCGVEFDKWLKPVAKKN